MNDSHSIVLYHTGFAEIRQPDIRYGRKNADFGQGFYLSDDGEFSRRWARTRKGCDTIVNAYALSLEGLRVKRFLRDAAWYDYIFANRAGRADSLAEYDVIVGPIANDTLYDTWGILTSGLLKREVSLRLLCGGPEYAQTVIKTERAAAQLFWRSAYTLSPEELEAGRAAVRREEAAYQAFIAKELGDTMAILK